MYVYMYVHTHVYTHVYVHACLCTHHTMLFLGKQRTTYRCHFSPPTLGPRNQSQVIRLNGNHPQSLSRLADPSLDSCTVVEEQYKEAEGRGGTHLDPSAWERK